MKYLLDTCALIWWTLDPEQLSDKAAKACIEIENSGGAISSISTWEIGLKVKNAKLDIGLSIENYLARIKKLNLEIIDVTSEIWLANLALRWSHRDPADRTIVATAKMHELKIVTADQVIRDFYKKSVW